MQIFHQKFDPSAKRSSKVEEATLNTIKEQLENVSNLDDDRIIRRYLDLILATLRTNFYQKDELGNEKSYVSYKNVTRAYS